MGKAPDAASKGKAEKEQEEAEKKEKQKRQESKIASEVAAKTKVVATANAAGALSQTANKDIAKVIGTMQQKYIENVNYDALVVACLTAMSKDLVPVPSEITTTKVTTKETTKDKSKTIITETLVTKERHPEKQVSALTKFCGGVDGKSGILAEIIRTSGTWVQEKIKRASLNKWGDNFKDAVDVIEGVKKKLENPSGDKDKTEAKKKKKPTTNPSPVADAGAAGAKKAPKTKPAPRKRVIEVPLKN